MFLFQDLPIEGVLKKIYKNWRGHKAEELVNNPCEYMRHPIKHYHESVAEQRLPEEMLT